MGVVYFSVIRDVLCQSVKFKRVMDCVIPWIKCRWFECQVENVISRKQKNKNEKKEENFCLKI